MALRTIAARTRSSALRLASPPPRFSPPTPRSSPQAAARRAFSSRLAVMFPGPSTPSMHLLTRPISHAAMSEGRTSRVHQSRYMSSLPSWMTSLSASDPADVFSKLKPESRQALYLAHLLLSDLEQSQNHEFLVLRTLLQEIQDGQDLLWSTLGDILAVTACGFTSLILFLSEAKDDTGNLLKGLSSNMGDIIPKVVSAVKKELPFYFGSGETFVWDDAWTEPKGDKEVSGKERKDAAKTEKKGSGKKGENAAKTEKKGSGKKGQVTEKKRPGKWF